MNVKISDRDQHFMWRLLVQQYRKSSNHTEVWTNEPNKVVMKFYNMYDPMKHSIWNEIGIFELSEQILSLHTLFIKNNEWITKIETEKLRRQIA